MPAAPKQTPIELTIAPESPEYKVVETLRVAFGTVSEKTGKTRRANGTDLVGQVISNLLLKASAETLAALSGEAVNKPGSNGKEPTLKIKEVIQAIADARSTVSTGAVDLSKLTDEELAAELKRREEAKKAGKGTKDVSAI